MNTTEPGLEFDCRDGIATSLVGKAELKALPFAATIHSKVWPFIERHFGNSSEISYFLWGGAATEALLPILGYTTSTNSRCRAVRVRICMRGTENSFVS